MKVEATQTDRAWVKPALAYKGTVGEILREGGGKTSTSPSDPGESRCPPSKCTGA
jgi:hypothetical protein